MVQRVGLHSLGELLHLDMKGLFLSLIVLSVTEVVLPVQQAILVVLVGALFAFPNPLQTDLQPALLRLKIPPGALSPLVGQLLPVLDRGNDAIEIRQHDFLQHLVGDAVLAAHSGTIALVGATAVIDSSGTPGLDHGPPTVAAAEEAGEGALVLLKIQLAGPLAQQFLHPLPLGAVNDGLVGVGNHRPVCPRLLLCFAVHGGTQGAPLFHIPRIHPVLQDAVNRGVGPVGGLSQPPAVVVALTGEPLVLTGAGNLLCIEQLGNSDFPIPPLKEIEDSLYHLGRRRVNQQMVMVVRVLPIPVAGEGPHKLAPLLLGVDGGAHLVRDVPGILGIEEVLHG